MIYSQSSFCDNFKSVER